MIWSYLEKVRKSKLISPVCVLNDDIETEFGK